MSQGVIKIALAMAFAALLPSCFGAQVNTRPIGPVALAYNFPKPSATPTETPQPQPSLTVGQVSPGQGAVEVRGFHEPPDWAHRNYCGAGATQFLLSAWMTDVPDIETVARASKLNDPPVGYCPGHNLVAARAVVTTSRRVWPADTVTDRMRQECHRE